MITVTMSMQLAVPIAATCSAGFLMVVSGLQKRMLERPTFGRCPSCGRRLEQRVCRSCAGR